LNTESKLSKYITFTEQKLSSDISFFYLVSRYIFPTLPGNRIQLQLWVFTWRMLSRHVLYLHA